MPKCSYCGKVYEPPRGLSLVLKDGTVKFLCSPKCRKNFYMGRRKVRWVSKKKKQKTEPLANSSSRTKETKKSA